MGQLQAQIKIKTQGSKKTKGRCERSNGPQLSGLSPTHLSQGKGVLKTLVINQRKKEKEGEEERIFGAAADGDTPHAVARSTAVRGGLLLSLASLSRFLCSHGRSRWFVFAAAVPARARGLRPSRGRCSRVVLAVQATSARVAVVWCGGRPSPAVAFFPSPSSRSSRVRGRVWPFAWSSRSRVAQGRGFRPFVGCRDCC